MASAPFGQSHPGKIYRYLANYGFTDRTNMFWYYDKRLGLNFGDWVGPYIFAVKTGRIARRVQPEKCRNACAFFTVGSILHRIEKANTAIVWGAGAISPTVTFAEPKEIRAVRGPLTRRVCIDLGYGCPPVFGDPAILLPDYYTPARASETHRLGVIPHYSDLDEVSRWFDAVEGVLVIDVRRPVERVVDDIVRCQRTLSSSLHGLIVSHAYGIASGWSEFSNRVIGEGFKFRDYFAAADDTGTPEPLVCRGRMPVDAIEDFIDRAPIPNIARLRHELLAACPF